MHHIMRDSRSRVDLVLAVSVAVLLAVGPGTDQVASGFRCTERFSESNEPSLSMQQCSVGETVIAWEGSLNYFAVAYTCFNSSQYQVDSGSLFGDIVSVEMSSGKRTISQEPGTLCTFSACYEAENGQTYSVSSSLECPLVPSSTSSLSPYPSSSSVSGMAAMTPLSSSTHVLVTPTATASVVVPPMPTSTTKTTTFTTGKHASSSETISAASTVYDQPLTTSSITPPSSGMHIRHGCT